MELKAFFTEYDKKLWMGIPVYGILDMGRDVSMTTVQQIIGGQIDRNAIQTASTWMYLVDGSIPLVVFPMEMLIKKLHISKLMGLVLFLVLFYTAKYRWGAFFHSLDIHRWNYNWFTPEQYNSTTGYLFFHPDILHSWVLVIVIGRALDRMLRLKF